MLFSEWSLGLQGTSGTQGALGTQGLQGTKGIETMPYFVNFCRIKQ